MRCITAWRRMLSWLHGDRSRAQAIARMRADWRAWAEVASGRAKKEYTKDFLVGEDD